MSTRLQKGGRLIDRARPAHFTFNGKRLRGYQGDTLASALLAMGWHVKLSLVSGAALRAYAITKGLLPTLPA